MYRLLMFLILLIVLNGCTSKNPPLMTVDQVNIERYSGKWYEIARYEHYFEKGCTNATAEYVVRKDGKISVTNKCVLEDGEPIEAVGVAYATDQTNSKLKVSFFRPFYGNYWILMLGDDYSYAVIGDPSREYLWILSRRSTLDPSVKRQILAGLPELGYDSSTLVWTQHDE